MAAGEGKRMNSVLPKVLHSFNGVPMLIRIIEETYKLEPSKIIIITGKYNLLIQSKINEYFVKNNNILEKINYIIQKNPLGTGDAIKSCLDIYSNNENILILNGDMPLIKFDLLKELIKNSNLVKLLVANLENPFGYGRILYDSNNEFIGIKEEKDCTTEEKNINIVNVGIYFFHSSILKKYIPMINNDNIQKEYYLTDIIKIIKNNTNILIDTYLVDNIYQYQIMGINTQDELINLENIYKNIYNK
jgi:UDP-N-acetylglucosamine diphosphorylase/glucosamine-1-phosphate N-acetyltransferase